MERNGKQIYNESYAWSTYEMEKQGKPFPFSSKVIEKAKSLYEEMKHIEPDPSEGWIRASAWLYRAIAEKLRQEFHDMTIGPNAAHYMIHGRKISTQDMYDLFDGEELTSLAAISLPLDGSAPPKAGRE